MIVVAADAFHAVEKDKSDLMGKHDEKDAALLDAQKDHQEDHSALALAQREHLQDHTKVSALQKQIFCLAVCCRSFFAFFLHSTHAAVGLEFRPYATLHRF